MRDKQCEVVRRELDQSALNEEFGGAAAEHMRACADCREFQRQQMKLRQIIGSLGTVNAPADFDFRLRARLAADSGRSSFHYWSFAVRGLATAAVLVVFGVGAVMVWQRVQDEDPGVTTAHQQALPQRQQEPQLPQGSASPKREEADRAGREDEPLVVINNPPPRRNSGRQTVYKPKWQVVSVDRSSRGANVMRLAQPTVDPAPVFPIDASLQSVRVSLDDGQGNARTISFPTVTFGSQRAVATGNQLASKGVW
ncbi:MAG TPA: hypothetical protein VFT02_07110 [Pyrinomonadaceae bacterium]|nr:hypothetical protein [Pyrinomonadaceae bacterium]